MYRLIRSSFLLLLLGLGGCSLYSFQGGGLPVEIRTAAVSPFENLTTDPTMAQEVGLAIRETVQRQLGLRSAAESQADAIVRGTVRGYDPDQPLAFTGVRTSADAARNVQVTRRQVVITVEVEIVDRLTEKAIMQRQTFRVDGDYESGNEAEGRRKALDKLMTQIVQKAREQW